MKQLIIVNGTIYTFKSGVTLTSRDANNFFHIPFDFFEYEQDIAELKKLEGKNVHLTYFNTNYRIDISGKFSIKFENEILVYVENYNVEKMG